MKRMQLLPVIAILIILYVLSTIAHYTITASEDTSQRDISIMLTERIHDAIESELKGPVMVAKTMSGDSFLGNEMKKEAAASGAGFEGVLKEYLENIKKESDCDTVFIISDSSRKYYTDAGIQKTIDTEKNSHDVWYNVFLSSGLPYVIDADVDENHNKEWTVFINARLEDSEGNLLGVCGVGIRMSDIQQLFDKYEREYGVKINLVDSDGLVQVDVIDSNVETAYRADMILSDSEDYVYENRSEGGYVITKYIESLNWYLAVQNSHTAAEAAPFKPGFILSGLIMLLAACGCCVIIFRRKDKDKNDGEETEYDEVTGVPNRSHFKAVYGEQNHFNTTKYKSVAVFDIDHFSNAVREQDGDMILRTVTECAKKIMGDECEIFRWRADEFAVFMDWSVDFAYNICNEFCREVAGQGIVTVSVGVTEAVLSDTIMKNYYRAVQGCFLVKEMGGNGVKRI